MQDQIKEVKMSSSSSDDDKTGVDTKTGVNTGLKPKGLSGVGAGTTDPLTPELRTKVHEAFRVFDHENNNTVDVREVGTIIRSLGFCPSEAELQEVLRDMEDPQAQW